MIDGVEILRTRVKIRRGELGLTQSDAAERGHVPKSTWESVEQAKTTRPKMTTLAGVDRALEWPTGTAYAILSGNEQRAAPVDEIDALDSDQRDALRGFLRSLHRT